MTPKPVNDNAEQIYEMGEHALQSVSSADEAEADEGSEANKD